ncbi:MAG: hypothetical protein ACOCV4_05760 [Myxococcota bacterium]
MTKPARYSRAALLAVLCTGCAGSTPPAADATSTPPAAEDPAPPPEPAGELDALLVADATADTEEEAYAEASRRLEAALYGSEAWADQLDRPVHDRSRDPVRVSADDGAVRVEVGLERDAVRSRLDALDTHGFDVDAPPSVTPAIEAALAAHLQRLVCERRRALLDEECTPVETDDVDAEVRTAALSILVEPKYADGVPLDDRGRPLRVATVQAQRVGAQGGLDPVAGLRLEVASAEGGEPPAALERTTVTTGPGGEGEFPLAEGATWPGALRVRVVAEDWLGPLARLWPTEPVRIEGRSTDLRRWSALVTEHVQGSRTRDGVFADRLSRTLRERGARTPASLSSEDEQRIERAIRRGRVERVLPTVADEQAGRLDVLLVAQVDSEFASRMGANRVWYEARGQIRAIDAWTGRTMATVDGAVSESGVGEERAARAARESLAQTLVDDLLQAVEGGAVAHGP